MITRTRCPRHSITLLAFLGASSLIGRPALAVQPDPVQRERLSQVRVPFVENCGQWDQRVAYAAKTGFGTAFVTQDGQLVYSLAGETEGWSLTETFVSGSPVSQPFQPAVTRVSYFRGNDPGRWQSGLPSYEEISLGEVWPGVSVSLRARGATVEKIFTVPPGAGAEKIRLRVDGGRSLRIDSDGSLVADTGSGDIRFTAPTAYQEQGGVRHPVTAAYVLHGSRYGFRLGDYDSSLPLIIDPLLQSTYLGGSLPEVTGGGEYVSGIAINPTSGEVFVTGWTSSTDFPGTTGGAQPANAGGEYPYDLFVARLDPTLRTLLQATYLGGSALEWGPPTMANHGIAINPTSGEVFVTGRTSSTDFPGTAGGFQPVPGDSFIARLDPTLTTLLQATYLGDTTEVRAIAVHPASGDVFVAGSTGSRFLDTTGGAQPVYGGLGDAFVARLDSSLTTLLQATYLGGSSGEAASCIAVDPASGEVLVSGSTRSTDFPGTVGGAQPGSGGDNDGFVARFNPSLTTLIQATYLRGSGSPSGLAIHPTTHEVLVTGDTDSIDFPGTAGGAQPNPGGGEDAFVARLDPALTTLLQATYLGGSSWEGAGGIAIHPATGQVFVTGTTESTDFPGTAGGVQPAIGGNPRFDKDAFVARLDPTLTTLLQSTYLGGGSPDYSSEIAIHPGSGEVFVAGYTFSYDLPGAAGGAQPEYKSGSGVSDGFVARLTPDLRGGEPVPCVPGPETLCLNGGRFEVKVAWSTPSSGTSSGRGVPLTGDTGYFWFFNSDNVELVVKVLDGRGSNGHYWVFYGALSNVQYTLTVRDAVTGALKTYSNPYGRLASVADTSAFNATGADASTAQTTSATDIDARSAEELHGLYTALTQRAAAPGLAAACSPDATTLCLNQSRFQLTVDWAVPDQGRSGQGMAMPLTDDTGYLWFFNDANIELVIKVLDGRTWNGHFWVFYGALSDVQYTITVTDTLTNTVRTYTNPYHTLASFADTTAF